MKECLLLLLLFPILSTQAQEEPVKFPINDAGRIEFTEVVAVDSVSAKELYSRARLFVANAFRSATDVTKLEDEETLTIVTKGLTPRIYTWSLNKDIGGNVRFKFTIQCKNGRYKYSVTDLVHEDTYTYGRITYSGGPLENEKQLCRMCMTKKTWADVKKAALVHINSFIQELTKGMKGVGVKNDW